MKYTDSINEQVLEAPAEVTQDELLNAARIRGLRNLCQFDLELGFLAQLTDQGLPNHLREAADMRRASLETAIKVLMDRLNTTTELVVVDEGLIDLTGVMPV